MTAKSRPLTNPHEALIRSHIQERSKSTLGLGDNWKLPEISAPSLEGLKVEVPAPKSVSVAELKAAYLFLLKEYSPKTARATGETVQPGDDVLVTYGATFSGHPIPFVCAVKRWLEITPTPPYEQSLANQFIGLPVGQHSAVGLLLGSDFPVASLRAQAVQVNVEIHAAKATALVAADNAEFLQWTGLGSDVEAVMNGIGVRLVEAAEKNFRATAVGHVLEELARRAEVIIADETLDEAIRELWFDAEGRTFLEWGATQEDAALVVDAWLGSDEIRASVARWLACLSVLRAVAKEHHIAVEGDAVMAELIQLVTATGAAEHSANAELLGDTSALKDLGKIFSTFKVVDFILSKAEVLPVETL